MSHEIDMTTGRAAMAYRNTETPWHGLGAALPAGESIEAWTQAAGMDWKIQRAVVRYATARDDGSMLAGDLSTLDDKHVLLRSDTRAPLGLVSDSYKIVQPQAVMEFFRDLVEEAGMELETAGVLHGGKRFWAMATIRNAVEGVIDRRDTVKANLLLSTSADGSLATEGRFTSIRVVCANTLGFARSAGKAQVRVTHRSVFDPVAAKKEMGINVEAVRERFAAEMATFRHLASVKMTQDDMVRMTLALVAGGQDKVEAMDRDEKVALAKKPAASVIGTMAATGRGLIGANMAGGVGTAWGWLNAVTQYADHHARARSQDNRLDSAWFGRGDSLKTQALEMITEVVGGAPVVSTVDSQPGSSLLDAVLANGVGN